MSKYKVPLLFNLLGFIINFNLFVQPLWGFLASLLILAIINFAIWRLIVFVFGRYLKNEETGNWVGGVVILLLSVYGYGLHFFPSWVSENPLASHQWRDSMKSLYKIIFSSSLIVLPLVIFFVGRKEQGRAFLNAFLISAVVIVSANKAWSYYRTYSLFTPKEPLKENTAQVSEGINKPDIYYFLLDGYTGNTALKTYWNFDNSSFTRELDSLDFKVADSARGNIAATIGALSFVFNLSMFDHPQLYEYNMDLTTHARIRNNELFRILDKNGYEVTANSIFFDQKPFFFSQGDMHPMAVNFSNFITRHLLFRLILKMADRIGGSAYRDYNWYYEYDKQVDRNINMQIMDTADQPGFYYNHLMITHPVFLYTATGERLDLHKHPSDSSNYLDQVRYTNMLCLKYFKALIAKYKALSRPLVIIAQSDHGSKEMNKREEESQIQLMVYDSQGKIDITQQEDGINLMRKVVSTYLGHPLAEQPYEYYNVFEKYR